MSPDPLIQAVRTRTLSSGMRQARIPLKGVSSATAGRGTISGSAMGSAARLIRTSCLMLEMSMHTLEKKNRIEIRTKEAQIFHPSRTICQPTRPVCRQERNRSRQWRWNCRVRIQRTGICAGWAGNSAGWGCRYFILSLLYVNPVIWQIQRNF